MNKSKLVGISLAAATGVAVAAVVGGSVLVASWREPVVTTGNAPAAATLPDAGARAPLAPSGQATAARSARDERMAARERARAQRAEAEAQKRHEAAMRETDAILSQDEDAEQRQQLEAARTRLRSASPDERIEAITDVADLDPVVATRELDNLLRGAESNDDVRLEAFDKLKDLTEEGPAMVDVLLRGLTDPSPSVREESAWLLSYEDYDNDPRIVQALHKAWASERNEDARTSIEDTLTSADPNFVPPDEAEPADAEPVDEVAEAASSGAQH